MKNPYQVLGIREDASVEEIKHAYKKLVRKYHPDQYANNPLSDLAEEKLKEINEAYDYLVKGKTNHRSYENRNNRNNNKYNSNENIFMQVRSLIQRNNLIRAEQLLKSVNEHNAEWYFLNGVVLLKKGWYDKAHEYISTAVSMNPRNTEYREVLNNISYRNTAYRNVGNVGGYRSSSSACDICSCLICTDCCCECLGGDFLTCC